MSSLYYISGERSDEDTPTIMNTHVFRGYRSDYGAGLGNIFMGLLRAAVSIIAPAVKNIGKTLVMAGSNRLSLILKNKLDPRHRTMVAPPPPPPLRPKKCK